MAKNPATDFQLHVNDEIEPEDSDVEAPLPEGDDVYEIDGIDVPSADILPPSPEA